MTSQISTARPMRVAATRWEADGIISFELRTLDDSELDRFEAGSHVDLELANGMIRSYSLTNPVDTTCDRYVIAVNVEAGGRGGSRFVHDTLRAGSVVNVSRPRNNFALREGAEHTVLFAGGIGITPILSMARRFESIGAPWQLYYAARSRLNAAFLADLQTLVGSAPERLRTHFDDETGTVFDLHSAVADAPAGAHLYCCGPEPMLKSFEQATASIAAELRHLEHFANTAPAAVGGGYTVQLARSAITLVVPPAQSILQTLLDAGIDVPYSCGEGVCGTCETAVLSGTPDHRDLVLSALEKSSNETMMICCSGCVGEGLVLDR